MTLGAGYHSVPEGHLAAVVTYLEMTAPSGSSQKPFPVGISASKEDMSNDAYRAVFKAIGAPWLWASRLTATDADLVKIITDPNVETWVVRDSGAAIGLIELDFRETNVCDVAFFGLIKEATGKGIGGPMMAHAQTRAFDRSVSLFKLHTCSLDSPGALAFYQKAGLVPVRRSIEIFPDPRHADIFPKTSAPQIPFI
jgi:GNAT superfamily N-acetyltransferase